MLGATALMPLFGMGAGGEEALKAGGEDVKFETIWAILSIVSQSSESVFVSFEAIALMAGLTGGGEASTISTSLKLLPSVFATFFGLRLRLFAESDGDFLLSLDLTEQTLSDETRIGDISFEFSTCIWKKMFLGNF
jgi:hypothetical protein